MRKYLIDSNMFGVIQAKRKNKMSGLCPCGYGFVNLKNELETVAAVQTHFEQHHKDLLPFGLNNSEALQLLNLTYAMGQKTRKSIFRKVEQIKLRAYLERRL